MFSRRLLIAFTLLAVVWADNSPITMPPPTTVPPTNTTTSTPSTTAQPTTSTSAVPPTSSEAPNTTTLAPTTAVPITTSPAPTPVGPKPWAVTNETTGVVCILAQMDLTLEIPYNSTSNKKLTAHVPVPSNATVSGQCGPSDQTMNIEWLTENKTSSLQFTFSKNDTTHKYWISKIHGKIAVTSLFPNISGEAQVIELMHDKNEFETPMNSSYYCKPVLQFNSQIAGSPNVTARFSFKDLNIEAFHLSNTTTFSKIVNCDNGQSPDLVPIVVGCALALLVLVVLIAYLVGRRQSLSSGYLSM